MTNHGKVISIIDLISEMAKEGASDCRIEAINHLTRLAQDYAFDLSNEIPRNFAGEVVQFTSDIQNGNKLMGNPDYSEDKVQDYLNYSIGELVDSCHRAELDLPKPNEFNPDDYPNY